MERMEWKMAEIGIIGAGSWGTAMSVLLGKTHQVTLWVYDPEQAAEMIRHRENQQFLPGVSLPDSVRPVTEIREAMEGKDCVIIAVPSHTVRQTAEKMKPYYTGQLLVNISKGLEEGTLLRLSQVVTQVIPDAKVAVMSGPSHAEEVGRGIPTTNVVACEDLALAKRVQDLVMSPAFRVYTNADVIGVELGGALKNVIALCAGILDGLGLGDNTKAALMTRGLAEITRLGCAMGARAETFSGLSGIGDLIVTCTSMHSRNRRAGILIGQGHSLEDTLSQVNMVVEGVKTAAAAHDLAQKYQVEMPICRQAYEVLFEGKTPADAIHDLMSREKKEETTYLNGEEGSAAE